MNTSKQPPTRHRLQPDKAMEQIGVNLNAAIDTGATSQSYKFNTCEKVFNKNCLNILNEKKI